MSRPIKYTKKVISDIFYKNGCELLSENCDNIYKYNLKQDKKKKSIYNGVSYSKIAKKWIACIVINKKQIHMGYYEDEKDAAKAYDDFILKNKRNLRYKLNFGHK